MEQFKLRYKPVKAVIFELDGLLIDSLPIQRFILVQIFLKYDKIVSRSMLNEVAGRSDTEAIDMLLEFTKIQDSCRPNILNEYRFRCKNSLPNVQKMTGAFELIRYFHSVGIQMGIASSCSQEHFWYKTAKYYNFFKDMFKSICLCDSDNEYGKPATQLHLQCAKDLCGVPLDQILGFESTKAGLEAALKCGMQVVMVPDSFMADPDSTRSSTLCIRTLNSFIPEEFGLPSKCKCVKSC